MRGRCSTGELGGVGERRSLVEGLVALVAELRRGSGPLALVVDDAQWGDPASLEFIDELAVRCEEIGVAVAVAIGTGQGGDEGPPLRRLAQAAGDVDAGARAAQCRRGARSRR